MQKASTTGAPVMRPLFFNFPEDKAAWDVSDAYCFGDDLVVAPIFEAGAVSRSIYLPAGTAWIDCASRVRYEGGQTVTVEAPMDVIPVFAREGASVLELM